jgi:hypothetical protein
MIGLEAIASPNLASQPASIVIVQHHKFRCNNKFRRDYANFSIRKKDHLFNLVHVQEDVKNSIKVQHKSTSKVEHKQGVKTSFITQASEASAIDPSVQKSEMITIQSPRFAEGTNSINHAEMTGPPPSPIPTNPRNSNSDK